MSEHLVRKDVHSIEYTITPEAHDEWMAPANVKLFPKTINEIKIEHASDEERIRELRVRHPQAAYTHDVRWWVSDLDKRVDVMVCMDWAISRSKVDE